MLSVSRYKMNANDQIYSLCSLEYTNMRTSFNNKIFNVRYNPFQSKKQKMCKQTNSLNIIILIINIKNQID